MQWGRIRVLFDTATEYCSFLKYNLLLHFHDKIVFRSLIMNFCVFVLHFLITLGGKKSLYSLEEWKETGHFML